MDQIQPVVNPELTAGNSEVVTTQAQELVAQGVTTPTPATQPGDKTDSALLLKSLQEEREKRRLAEEEARLLREQTINTPTPSEMEQSDEGRLLQEQINQLKEERELERVYNQFPDLRNLSSEYESYRKDYPRHKEENVAKLFLVEKGLIDQPRKGLEQPTGGPKTPQKSGMTAQEVADLRKNNFKKYSEMVQKGQIQIVE